MKEPFRIILCELPLAFRFPNNLAISYLQSMVERAIPRDDVEVKTISRTLMSKLGDKALIRTILNERPDLVGFSCYLWNVTRSLHILRSVKSANPRIMTILGGPEVTADNPMVSTVPEIDFMVFGEGEWTFLQLVRHLVEGRDLTSVEGLGFRIDTELVVNPPRKPGASLDDIPSPYLSSVMPISGSHDMHLEIDRGCHYQCSYCFYSKNFPHVRYFSLERLRQEIEYAKSKGVRSIWLSDPCFNANRSRFYELCELLSRVNRDRSIVFHTEIKAELVVQNDAKLLDDANIRFVSVGLQSTNPVALKNVNRDVNLGAFAEGVRRLLDNDITTQIDIMIGLPGDSLMDIRKTIGFVDDLSRKCVKAFSMTKVLPGTELRRSARRFGIVFQELPPYCVLETREIPNTDLMQLAMLEPPPWLMRRKPFLIGDFPPHRSCLRPLNAESEVPVRCLKVDIDGPSIDANLFASILDQSALQLSLRFDVRANDSEDTVSFETLLSKFVEGLPFSFLDIIINSGFMQRRGAIDSLKRAALRIRQSLVSDIAPCNLGISQLSLFHIVTMSDLHELLEDIAEQQRDDVWPECLMRLSTMGKIRIHQPSHYNESFILKVQFPLDIDALISCLQRIPADDYQFAVMADFENAEDFASVLESMAQLRKMDMAVWFTDSILEGVWRTMFEQDTSLEAIFASLIRNSRTDSRMVVWPEDRRPLEMSFSRECIDVAMEWALAIQKWKETS